MKIIAFISLIISLPFLLIISLLIVIESGSKVIFKQTRIGLNKNEFEIYKFKTMENEKITKVGRVLRKLGLDEIPQLVNIIKGEMSFVGPRPLTYSDIKRLEWDKKEFNKRWSVKPGITGIAQLSKICDANLSMQNDLFYVQNKSFLLDIKTIIKSIFIPIFGK